jgi:hypothetical protein
MLTYFTQEYAPNLKLYTKTHFESMRKRWIKHCLKCYVASHRQLQGTWQDWYGNMPKKTEDEDDEQGDDALDMVLDDDEDLV